MASKIYISGFPSSYTQGQLRQIFIPFGKVESVQVLRDARGYFVGVVQMSSPEDVEHIFGGNKSFKWKASIWTSGNPRKQTTRRDDTPDTRT